MFCLVIFLVQINIWIIPHKVVINKSGKYNFFSYPNSVYFVLESVIDQQFYFDWYFVATNLVSVIASTAMVYIEDNVSWAIGFGLSAAANLLGSVIFLLGSRFYYSPKVDRSPFTDIAHVIVATTRKWNVPLSFKSEDYYCGHDPELKKIKTAPTNSFR